MFAEIEYPKKLLPEELDQYLARGWFRMRQTIFTTNFLHFKQQFYSAIWLRVLLDDSIYDKKYFALAKQNKKFRSEIKKSLKGAISSQHQALYEHYRQSISFDVSATLTELLSGNEIYNRFNTYEVNIYDGDTLIGAGFFDMGEKSAAGITSIYHPAYKKYTLGKYLMYLKMDFCKQQEVHFFYPGYVVPGYTPFDYKLEIGKATLQYLQLATQKWIPVASSIENPLQEMTKKLAVLEQNLSQDNIANALLNYKFFEVNLEPYYHGQQLFDFPVFLFCSPITEAPFYNIIVYDVRGAKYKLLQCYSIMNIGVQGVGSDIFDSDLLKVKRVLFSTEIKDEMVYFLVAMMEKRIIL
ncbi:MAG: hypothetical protein ABIN01_22235 [Ferruginibacter sp.]